jgi:hypothetical protein
VVRLDGDRRAAGGGDALDHVGVERALGQEVGAADLGLLLLEDLDEEAADGLALRLGVGDAAELAEEEVDASRWIRRMLKRSRKVATTCSLSPPASARGRRRCR